MVHESDVVRISLQSIREEIDFACFTAFEKSRKSNTQNTWQSDRSEFRKFTDLFPGDLAKNVVRHHLAKEGIVVEDYDKIRTDQFQKNDLFDLKHDSRFIEVKSSIEKYNTTLANLIGRRRIIIYADRPLNDFIVQVFFPFRGEACRLFFRDMESLAEGTFRGEVFNCR